MQIGVTKIRKDAMQEQHDSLKQVVDILSISTVVATLAAWLPPIAALFTIIWTAIRIIETKTVQDLVKKWSRK